MRRVNDEKTGGVADAGIPDAATDTAEDLRAENETLRRSLKTANGQVERLKNELRIREASTVYEVEAFVVSEWRSAWRGPSRFVALEEGKRLSAERIAGDPAGQPYVRVRGVEDVWTNTAEVERSRASVRSSVYASSPPDNATPPGAAPGHPNQAPGVPRPIINEQGPGVGR